jgi:hypothetical protein
MSLLNQTARIKYATAQSLLRLPLSHRPFAPDITHSRQWSRPAITPTEPTVGFSFAHQARFRVALGTPPGLSMRPPNKPLQPGRLFFLRLHLGGPTQTTPYSSRTQKLPSDCSGIVWWVPFSPRIPVKTELRPVPHSILPGVTIFEIWHDGQFIARESPDIYSRICLTSGPRG